MTNEDDAAELDAEVDDAAEVAFREWLGDRYWDLSVQTKMSGSYSDWEGFAEPGKLSEQIRWIKQKVDENWNDSVQPEGFYTHNLPMIADLVLHLVYENLDQGDYLMTEKEVKDAFDILEYALAHVRDWMKSPFDWTLGREEFNDFVTQFAEDNTREE